MCPFWIEFAEIPKRTFSSRMHTTFTYIGRKSRHAYIYTYAYTACLEDWRDEVSFQNSIGKNDSQFVSKDSAEGNCHFCAQSFMPTNQPTNHSSAL
jgi:hypothetical protein